MPIRSSLLLTGMLLAIWLPGDLHATASRVVAAAIALSLCIPRLRPLLFAGLGFFLASHAVSRVLVQRLPATNASWSRQKSSPYRSAREPDCNLMRKSIFRVSQGGLQ